MQVSDSLEALEVGGLVSYVLIQAIRAAMAEVGNWVPGSGGGGGGGRLWREAYRVRCRERNVMNRINRG